MGSGLAKGAEHPGILRVLEGSEAEPLNSPSMNYYDILARFSHGTDLLNASLVLENPAAESALPLRGKKRKLTRRDWLGYFCRERLGLAQAFLDGIQGELAAAYGPLLGRIERSFLSAAPKSAYRQFLEERMRRPGLRS